MIEENKNNLRFYIESQQPPAEACKPFQRQGGFSGTDINAMWRIKQLTELFGPCGIGWYTEVTKREIIQFDVTRQKAFVDINLFIKDPSTGEWSKPIQGTGGNDFVTKRKSGDIVVNDECFKMAETDALGSACKKLGFGASIYWDQDKTKYTTDEEGNYYQVVMTAEEVKQQKAEERKKAAESFGKRPDNKQTEASFTTADQYSEDKGLALAAECKKAIGDWMEDDMVNNGVNEIWTTFCDTRGAPPKWGEGVWIQLYKELKAANTPGLREVQL